MAASTKKKGVVDPTKAGKYPVILSDALLGKSSKESFTGIQCTKEDPSLGIVPLRFRFHFHFHPSLFFFSLPHTSTNSTSASAGRLRFLQIPRMLID